MDERLHARNTLLVIKANYKLTLTQEMALSKTRFSECLDRLDPETPIACTIDEISRWWEMGKRLLGYAASI